MAVTVLATICTIDVNSCTVLVRSVESRTGTNTSDPGPGLDGSTGQRLVPSPGEELDPAAPAQAGDMLRVQRRARSQGVVEVCRGGVPPVLHQPDQEGAGVRAAGHGREHARTRRQQPD